MTAAGFGDNYVKMCKSASRFTCLSISLNRGGISHPGRGDTYFDVGSREVAKKKKKIRVVSVCNLFKRLSLRI